MRSISAAFWVRLDDAAVALHAVGARDTVHRQIERRDDRHAKRVRAHASSSAACRILMSRYVASSAM